MKQILDGRKMNQDKQYLVTFKEWDSEHDCYSSRLSDKSKEKPCIGFIQENSIEFLVQYVYLIYTRLMVHAI